ncbi:unnamed protein product [Amaranthus hypochondriacus]
MGLIEVEINQIFDWNYSFLVQQLDPNFRTQKFLNGSRYVIDINYILGLPLNHSKSIKLSKNADDGIISEWKTVVGQKVYSAVILLWPLSDFKVRKTRLTFVEDMVVIPTHNSCTFVFDLLCDLVDKFQECCKRKKKLVLVISLADFTGLPINRTFKDLCLREEEVVGGSNDNQGNEVDNASQGKFLILPLSEFSSDEEVREQAKDNVSKVISIGIQPRIVKF